MQFWLSKKLIFKGADSNPINEVKAMKSLQYPIKSDFDATSTATQVMGNIDLTDKLAVVTGGYSGLGREVVRVLLGAGASVIVPARDVEKARHVLAALPDVRVCAMDLADPESIDAFANLLHQEAKPIDFLINNAGVMAMPLTRDRRDYEMQMVVNHFGHFQLTARLWSCIKEAEKPRVVCLSSGAHRFSSIDFDDPHYFVRPYNPWQAYGQSKTANALFALELNRRARDYPMLAFSVHPGSILTDLSRHLSLEDMQAMGFRDEKGEIPKEDKYRFKSVGQGAATTIWCATSPLLENIGGVYCEDCNIARSVSVDWKERNGILPWACDLENAERLWQLTEEQIGVNFEI
jgi:NAD(P)-dependent dehydrogenase (short-subunit alcohol dehydrogenase family)